MHVLVIPSWYPQYEGDPSGSFFREQAIALARRIDKVGVLNPNLKSLRELLSPRAKRRGQQAANDEGTFRVQRNGYNLTPRFALGFEWQWMLQGMQLFEYYVKNNGKPDVIHAHCALYAGLLARSIGVEYKIPYVITEHSSAYFSKALSINQLRKAADVYAHAARRIAVSHSLSSLLSKEYNFGEFWSVVPNIVSGRFFDQTIGSALSIGSTRFLNVALLNYNKRQDLLLAALRICHDLGYSHFQLTIAGDGPLRESLGRNINALNLQNFAQLLGEVPHNQMPNLMSRNDIFLLSSNYETFGVVVAEALATGLFCVSTDCGGPSDIIKQGDGVIVPTGDANAMAQAMIMAATSTDRPNVFARRASSFARFSEEAVCQTLIKTYEEVLFAGRGFSKSPKT